MHLPAALLAQLPQPLFDQQVHQDPNSIIADSGRLPSSSWLQANWTRLAAAVAGDLACRIDQQTAAQVLRCDQRVATLHGLAANRQLDGDTVAAVAARLVDRGDHTKLATLLETFAPVYPGRIVALLQQPPVVAALTRDPQLITSRLAQLAASCAAQLAAGPGDQLRHTVPVQVALAVRATAAGGDPAAAALLHRDEQLCAAQFDLGGGSLDVVLAEVADNQWPQLLDRFPQLAQAMLHRYVQFCSDLDLDALAGPALIFRITDEHLLREVAANTARVDAPLMRQLVASNSRWLVSARLRAVSDAAVRPLLESGQYRLASTVLDDHHQLATVAAVTGSGARIGTNSRLSVDRLVQLLGADVPGPTYQWVLEQLPAVLRVSELTGARRSAGQTAAQRLGLQGQLRSTAVLLLLDPQQRRRLFQRFPAPQTLPVMVDYVDEYTAQHPLGHAQLRQMVTEFGPVDAGQQRAVMQRLDLADEETFQIADTAASLHPTMLPVLLDQVGAHRRVALARAIVRRLEYSSSSDVSDHAQQLLDHAPACALVHSPVTAHMLAEQVASACGDDVAQWEMAVTLLETYEAALPSLLATIQRL